MNKYIIVTVIMVVFIGFIDQNSVTRRLKLERDIAKVRKEIRKYEILRDESTASLENLQAGKDELERIAREHYLMKKKDEDIFLIENAPE